MTVNVLSFLAGLPNEEKIIQRFVEQALSCEFIDEVRVVDSKDSLFLDFCLEYGDFVKANPKGYGYWLWKPYIVLNYMKNLNSGDILFYCDAGCELSFKGKKRFDEYLTYLESNDLLVFSTFNKQPEYMWSKKDAVDFFELSAKEMKSEQIAATYFILKVNDYSKALVQEWLDICIYENFRLINDISIKRQHKKFIEHRYDQSLFSMLLKSKKVSCLRERSYFPQVLYYKNSYIYNYPIHALRNKGIGRFIKFDNLVCNNNNNTVYQLAKYHFVFLCHRVIRKIRVAFKMKL